MSLQNRLSVIENDKIVDRVELAIARQKKRSRDEKIENPAVVVVGNPCDGFRFHGPFKNAGAANNWADDESSLNGLELWVATMTPATTRELPLGVEIVIEGGVLQECNIDLGCHECGASVTNADGYNLIDKD